MSRKCIWLAVSVMAIAWFTGLACGQTVYINFQKEGGDVPEGYLPDYGDPFGDRGNGFSYGWDKDITGDARDRDNAIAPDQRYDTTNHLQKGTPAIWEIELENGVYDLFLVGGDSNHTDQTNHFLVEGMRVEDPDGQDNFDEWELTVTVEDGRLTITADEDASNSKIMFVDIVLAIPPEAARSPSPANEATDIPRDTTLAWAPGEGVTGHDVYLGTSLDDVNTASRADAMDVLLSQGQSGLTFDAPRLEFGQTYYWRIDEVLTDGSIFQGELWSFTVEPFTYAVANIVASTNVPSDPGLGLENTINGSGLSADGQHSIESGDMWLGKSDVNEAVWLQYELDGVYKLHEMLVWNYNVQFEPVLGMGLKDVSIEYSVDGAEWTILGDVELGQATGKTGYTANTAVDFGGVAVKYVKVMVNSNFGGLTQYGLSEVCFMYIPATAREPQPASEASEVSVDSVLSWRAGREAASHEVYLGTDAEALALAGSVDEASYSPGLLDLGTTYYWKVDEANEAEAISLWESGVWSFTTQAFLVVDDFESYTDDEGGRVYEVWADGWVNDTGSTVGYFEAPFAEQTIVNSGNQSMPLFYDNSDYATSEADLELSQDWTASGVKSLSLYFQGDPENSGGQLYVKINGTKVAYDGDAADITLAAWQAWNIDLSTVGNVSNVNSLTIGIEGAGAAGIVYIDDVRLYPLTPEYIVPSEPDNANLVALYDFEGNANDGSGNGLDGAVVDGQLLGPGKLGQGTAVQLAAAGYVDLGNPAALDFSTGDWTVTAWFKTAMTGTGDENKGTIYGKGGDSGGGHRYALIMSESTEGVVTLVCDDDSTKILVHSTSVTNDDEWHCVTGQREGTAIEIYIDGLLEGTATADADYDLAGTSQHNAYIGAITNHGDSSLYKLFNGLIDDVRIDGCALSDGELLWLAGRTAPVSKPF